MSARPLRLATGSTTDALTTLVTAWRSTAGTLRRYGDVRGADLVEHLVSELAAALSGGAGVPERAAPVRERGDEPDRLLTVEEAAAKLGVSRSWLHRHWRDPGLQACARKLGPRTLRFSERALDQHLRR